MNDTIYRQDAIDACCFGITHARAINVETEAVVDLFEASNKELHKAIERIEALPPAQPHWIPCSERLPEDGRRVLFQMTNGYIDVLRFNATGITTHLVAWMPLPKPYGGDAK